MLLAAVAKAGLPQVIDHGFATHLVIVIIGDVVVLTLEGLACGIFALACDLADTSCVFENVADVNTTRTRDVGLAGSPERRGKVLENGGEWSGGQAREGQLVDGVIPNSLEAFVFDLSHFLLGTILPLLGGDRGLPRRLHGLEGLSWQ